MANQNKDAAISFLKMASRGDVRGAYSKFVGPGFRHHNPYFEGSAETLMTGMGAMPDGYGMAFSPNGRQSLSLSNALHENTTRRRVAPSAS